MKLLSRSKAKRKARFEKTRTLLTEKVRESLVSVLPIIAIVTVLCLFLVPMQPNLLLTFLIGALMIVVGLGLFSLGAERSMTIIGNKIGTALTKIGKLPVILLVAFALGVAVTVAEPDLQVLADTVPNIDKTVLLLAVGIGAIAALDLLFLRRIGLVPVLIAGYALFRTLSRNLPARQAEDLLVRGKCSRVKANLSGAVQRAKQSRDYRFFSCPGCRSCLRVPRGKGRIQVTCPRCGHRFDRRS